MMVVPGLRVTSPSIIWRIGRSDSPSETSDGSRVFGSADDANTSVVLLAAPAVLTIAATAVAAVASGMRSLSDGDLTSSPFSKWPGRESIPRCPRLGAAENCPDLASDRRDREQLPALGGEPVELLGPLVVVAREDNGTIVLGSDRACERAARDRKLD